MRLSAASLALAALATTAAAKSGPVCAAYISTGQGNVTDLPRYTLEDGSNVFDVGIIFAADINNNGTGPVLYYNEALQEVLNDTARHVKPAQDAGIKIVLSLLGNHQGYGLSNFQTQADAAAFAKTVSDAVTASNLDGIDIDDEYADYGTRNTSKTNDKSIGWFISAYRALNPNKLITFYNIGPASIALSLGSTSTGAQVDYAWNPYYGQFNVPDIPGLNKSELSPAAVWYDQTSEDKAKSLAHQTVSAGYGAFLTFSLPVGNLSKYVSSFTEGLYGQNATYKIESNSTSSTNGTRDGC